MKIEKSPQTLTLMKHTNATLQDVAEYGNLLIASAKARQGKSHYQSVKEFEEDKTNLLNKLSELLLSGKYRTSEYRREIINDNGKERLISKLPYYPDRIVHWAIMLQIEDSFLNHFTEDTHAAIPNRGAHTALKRVRYALASDVEGTRWCLKIDVRKYFPHVNHAVLKGFVGKLVSDYGLRMLIYEIIDSDDEGLPIGNYLSQYLANLYLSWFDRWVHEVLGVKHYIRYMDDMVFLSDSKDTLRKVFREVEWYLRRNLYLEIKDNWQIFKTSDRYIDFIGYKVKRNIVILRKRTWLRLLRKCRLFSDYQFLSNRNRSSIMAYVGWACHCSHKVRKNIYTHQFKPILDNCGIHLNKRTSEKYGTNYPKQCI